MKFAAWILALSTAFSNAQNTTSAHSGWNFDDTRQTAKLVVIADIESGSAVDAGSQITVRAKARVVRTLMGEVVMGTMLPVTWQYAPAPSDTPAAIATFPHSRAIFFLVGKGDGYEALQASMMPTLFGGYFIEVPVTPLPGDLFYGADATLDVKLSSELAWALEDLDIRNASDFGPQKAQQVNPASPPAFVRTRMQHHALSDLLAALDKKSTTTAMLHLSASPNANVRLLGLLGRIRNSDTDAVTELERDLPRLARTFDANASSRYIMEFDWEHQPAAALAFGRMALAETTFQGLDSVFAMRVSRNSGMTVLPFLTAILHSPEAYPRDTAISAICQVVRNETKYWKTEMEAQCPTRTPIPDHQQEQAMLQFWSQWWAGQRDAISKETALADVSIPSLYSRPARDIQMTEVPLEIRFQSLLHMARASATHVHGENGQILDSAPPQPMDPLSSRLSESDREVYQHSITQTLARLDAEDEKMHALMNAARQQGAMPAREQMVAAGAARTAILKEEFAALEQKLSPEGGVQLQQFFNSFGSASGQTAPAH